MEQPASDEIEVTVFGPGFGECVAIHVGAGDWVVVDSCIDSRSGRPAALTYFDQIGIDAGSQVKLILTTHWHDDHIGGMSELVKACSTAIFSCAAALGMKEFLKVAQLFSKNAIAVGTSGTSEIQKVLSILISRGVFPRYAMADREILKISDGVGLRCRITALSPSDAEYDRFLKAMSSLLPRSGDTKFRCPDLQPNDLSVASWVQTDDLMKPLDVLLGGDLEEHQVAGRGWSAVIASTNPTRPAIAFKIAHHGSITGHHDGIWAQLLSPDAVAILTPWNRGKKLPTENDCNRIRALTLRAYATSRAISQKTKVRASAVSRTLRESGIRVRSAEPPTGYVQLRRKTIEPNWRIQLSPDSFPLGRYIAAST